MPRKDELRDKYSLEDIDLCRQLGLLYFTDEETDHISVEICHNFICPICEHYLNREDGFLIIPLSNLKKLKDKIKNVKNKKR